jgi:hypothetical protein
VAARYAALDRLGLLTYAPSGAIVSDHMDDQKSTGILAGFHRPMLLQIESLATRASGHRGRGLSVLAERSC